MRNVLPKTGWLIKAGQKASKVSRRDIVIEFGTVPPREGWLSYGGGRGVAKKSRQEERRITGSKHAGTNGHITASYAEMVTREHGNNVG